MWVNANEYYDGQWGNNGQTDQDGIYRINGLAAGDYRVEVFPNDSPYVMEFYNDTYHWHEAQPVSVTSGTETPGIDFGLALGGSISGEVIPDGGGQISGIVSIEVWDYDSGEGRGAYQTNSGGTYSIPGLPAGKYRLMANAIGTEYASEYYNDAFSWNSASAVTVTAGVDTPNIDFSLGQGSFISGFVLGQGDPIPGAWVSVHTFNDGTWFGGVNADQNGFYKMDGLPPGDYRVEVDAWGTPYAWEIYDGTYNFDEAVPVTVAIGAPATDINFDLKQTGTISGTVTNQATSEKLPNMRVVAKMYHQDWWSIDAFTDAEGKFTIEGLPPTGYRVEFDPQGANFIREYYDNSTDDNTATRVDVNPDDDTSGIDFADFP